MATPKAPANEDTVDTSATRGMTIRNQFGRDNDDDEGLVNESEAMSGKDMPNQGLSRQITGGSVPEI